MLQLTNYVGTKKVRAVAMTKIAYNQLRGWAMPEGEDGTEKGYLVEYPDSVPNHPEFGGYISWSPKQVFEEAYSKYDELCFGKALELLKEGLRLVRRCNSITGLGIDNSIRLYLKNNTIVWSDGLPFIPTSEDLLANDWQVVL